MQDLKNAQLAKVKSLSQIHLQRRIKVTDTKTNELPLMKKSSASKHNQQNALAARLAAQSHGHHVHHQPIHEHSLASKSESGFKNSRNMKNDF